MALINCPECKKEVSGLAKTCPNCGIGINDGSMGKVTIQQTSKRLKLHMIFAFFLMIPLPIILIFFIQTDNIFPISSAIVGTMWSITTSIRMWWHHG